MNKNLEIAELEDRLKQLDSMISSQEALSKDDEIAQLEGRLAQIDSQIMASETSELKNQDLSLKDQALQVARGGAKTIGGISDIVRSTIPTVESVKKMSLEPLIRSLEGVPERADELAALKQEYLKNDEDINQSKQQQFVKNIDELAGKDLTPTTTGGKFREKLGEFGVPLPIPGGAAAIKAAPAIAATSTALRELGLDESYSDLISAIGVPNAKAISQLPGRVLKKLGDYIATIGSKEYREAGNVEKAAKFLQEKVGESNIPGVVEKIDNYKNPFPGNPAEGEAGYRPLTADIADDVGLSQYHRAKAENIPEVGKRRQTNEEVLQREVDKLAAKEASPQVSQEFAAAERKGFVEGLEAEELAARNITESAAGKFDKTAKIDQSGREVQEYLADRVSGIEKKAQSESKPLYEAAKEKSLEGRPASAFDYIDEQMQEWSRASPINRDMRKAKIALENSASNSVIERKKLIDSAKKKYKDDPNMLTIALKEIDNVPHGTYNAGKLDKAKREISGILESVPYSEKERRRALTNLLEKLDKDMESIPEIFQARQVYREVIKPANVITENPILGKLIHQESGYTRPFTVTHAEIPDRVIKGSKSIEGAKALMSEAAGVGTKEHKQMLDTLKSYINSDILANFVETNGKVNPDKFKTWSKNNPGAFILYPELKTKLKNLENAQVHVDRVIKQNEELLSKFYSKSMEHFLGPKFKGIDPDRIAGKILGSTNSVATMEEAVELLSKDKTGNALEGLKRGLINHLNSKFKSDKFTFATLNDYLKTNKKAFEKVFTKEQMEVLENTKDLLKKQAVMERAGKGTNSDSVPKLLENIAEKTGGQASKALFGIGKLSFLSSVKDYAKNIGEMGKIKYLEQALLEPELAKVLLTKDVKTKKNFFESLDNKKYFGKWLRDSEDLLDTFGVALKEVGKNFSITSQAIAKTAINDKF